MNSRRFGVVFQYALVIGCSAAGVAIASGLEIHTDGELVNANSVGNVFVPLTVTVDGVPTSSVGFMTTVVDWPSTQCRPTVYNPVPSWTSNTIGSFMLPAFVGPCNSPTNASYTWKKGKTSIRVQAFANTTSGVTRGETVLGIDVE